MKNNLNSPIGISIALFVFIFALAALKAEKPKQESLRYPAGTHLAESLQSPSKSLK